MLRLAESRDEIKVVEDQWGCPTSASEIARVLLAVARRVAYDPDPNLRGVFHMTGKGETNWAGFAESIFAAAKIRGAKVAQIIPIPSTEYPTPARRPENSRLSWHKLHTIYGISLEPWQVSLNLCLDRLIGEKRG